MTSRNYAWVHHLAKILMVTWMTAALAACASLPDDAPVVEKLDEETGMTVARLGRPVELYLESRYRSTADRFAFLGPFETNHMGSRDTFLWIAVPLAKPDDSPVPTVWVDGVALELGDAGRTAEFAGLRKSAYPISTPWIATYYFRIGAEVITRLGAAHDLRIRANDQVRSGPLDLEYRATPGQEARLAEFAAR